MFERILNVSQFDEIANESRLFLTFHIQFDHQVEWRIRYIVHGWVMGLTMHRNNIGDIVSRQSMIFGNIHIIYWLWLEAIVPLCVPVDEDETGTEKY